jgi:hypothetical protein
MAAAAKPFSQTVQVIIFVSLFGFREAAGQVICPVPSSQYQANKRAGGSQLGKSAKELKAKAKDSVNLL